MDWGTTQFEFDVFIVYIFSELNWFVWTTFVCGDQIGWFAVHGSKKGELVLAKYGYHLRFTTKTLQKSPMLVKLFSPNFQPLGVMYTCRLEWSWRETLYLHRRNG